MKTFEKLNVVLNVPDDDADTIQKLIAQGFKEVQPQKSAAKGSKGAAVKEE